MEQVSKRGQTLVGIPTGYRSMDALFGGWQRSDLIIIAARTSMGKTAFALGSALAAAKEGYRVGVLSIEMSCRQVGLRLHGILAPIDVHALKTGALHHSKAGLFSRKRLINLNHSHSGSMIPPCSPSSTSPPRPDSYKREAGWICWSWTICNSSNSMTPKIGNRASQTHHGNSSCSRKSWIFPSWSCPALPSL